MDSTIPHGRHLSSGNRSVFARAASWLGRNAWSLLRRAQAVGYRVKNRAKPKILLYTDSRGVNVASPLHKVDPFACYPGALIRDYCVDFKLAPHKHTTIVDFLQFYEKLTSQYDCIIAHVGIVDFSPRPVKLARRQIYSKKKLGYDSLFCEREMLDHLDSCFSVEYEGELTNNMFSMYMAEKYLIPKLGQIKNLIFIGCNRVVKNWNGNYFRERPKNIGIIEDYSRLICAALPNCVDLEVWTDEEIKARTYDNIHFTEKGSAALLGQLNPQISEMI